MRLHNCGNPRFSLEMIYKWWISLSNSVSLFIEGHPDSDVDVISGVCPSLLNKHEQTQWPKVKLW